MKNVRRYSLLILSGILFFVVACQKDDGEKKPPVNPVEIQNLTIKNDHQQLNQRMGYKDELVKMIPHYKTELKSDALPEKDLTSNFAFKLRANVVAPVSEGRTLMATHVAIKDQYAFVSYNIRGAEYGGAVEVFNVSVTTQPQIISNATFVDADINALDYRDKKIFIVGATEDFYDMEFESPAFFQVLNVNDQMLIESVDTIIDIPSFSANSIRVTNDKIFITSGDNGGLTVLDREYNILQNVNIADARSIDTNSNNAYVLSGQPGKLNIFDIASGNSVAEYATGGANTPHSKSEISVTEDYAFVALNEAGVKVLDLNGAIKQHIPKPETPAGGQEENHVTNSVSVNHSLVFMANGQSGITVGEVIPAMDDQVVMLGTMVFNDMHSSNYVHSRDSIVFVASGLGGLKILSFSIDQGVPDDIIPTEPCHTLMSAISQQLPERKDARVHSPELFLPNNELNVITTEKTSVYVVFIHEGAGWKNTFGYYAYPADNPPTSTSELEKYVVFPNVSLVNDGGGLEPGDMVQLGTEPFPANTVIGFYIVAQGWANGQMVDGVYTHYTNRKFNNNNIQQHVLFVENGCEDLVLAFEDERLPGGDKDYNDIILVIKDNDLSIPNTKFNADGVVQINITD